MEQLFNTAVSIVFDGIAFAMILFIISVGLSVTMGLMGFVNLAHGAFAMLGGYLSMSFATSLGIPFLLAVILCFIAVALISVVFERLLYARFYGASDLDQVLLTIGLVFMAIAGATLVWGPLNVQLNVPSYLKGQVNLGFREFPTYRTFIIVVSVAIIIGLWYGLERTRIGAMIRAAVDNRRMAQSIGIDVDRLFTLTFALGSGLAGVGGALGTEILGLTPTYAMEYLVYFLIVVAVGGMGSIRGAFAAALILGVIDTGGKYLLPEFGAFFIFFVTIAILLWRPQGLFGK
ncbi:MAG: branched-chain amino acid ABC transporter permease [Rhodospirillales bacterium]|nr:branched-chain amino acid ABC transporter permease [Rhodospirillales bacterium]